MVDPEAIEEPQLSRNYEVRCLEEVPSRGWMAKAKDAIGMVFSRLVLDQDVLLCCGVMPRPR